MQQQDPELWARRASSFGGAPREYADHRPDYAPAGIAWALAGAERPVREAIDLGAGTGALTAGLVAAGVAVTAVEPDGEMLAELSRRLPHVPALRGSAEAIPLRDDNADAVLVGTAFHWFEHERAMPEIARVLRPGGVLALLYNEDDETVPWVAELGKVSRTSASSQPSDEDWPTHPQFAAFEEERFAHRQRRTADSLTVTIGTHSHTVVVTPEERAATLVRIREFLGTQPETATGSFDRPLVTVVARALVTN